MKLIELFDMPEKDPWLPLQSLLWSNAHDAKRASKPEHFSLFQQTEWHRCQIHHQGHE